MKKAIIAVIIGVVVIACAAGYLIFNNNKRDDFPRRDFSGNGFREGMFNRSMELNESVKQEITNFFQNTDDINEIRSYCEKNRMYCGYYCREINPSFEICAEFQRPMNDSFRHMGYRPQNINGDLQR